MFGKVAYKHADSQTCPPKTPHNSFPRTSTRFPRTFMKNARTQTARPHELPRTSTNFHPLSTNFHPLSTNFHPLSTNFHPLSTNFHPLSTNFHPLSTNFPRNSSMHFHGLPRTSTHFPRTSTRFPRTSTNFHPLSTNFHALSTKFLKESLQHWPCENSFVHFVKDRPRPLSKIIFLPEEPVLTGFSFGGPGILQFGRASVVSPSVTSRHTSSTHCQPPPPPGNSPSVACLQTQNQQRSDHSKIQRSFSKDSARITSSSAY